MKLYNRDLAGTICCELVRDYESGQSCICEKPEDSGPLREGFPPWCDGTDAAEAFQKEQ